jgi:hypothetical protein
MSSKTIERLLEAANASDKNNTSVNLAKRQFLDQADADRFYDSAKTDLSNIGQWGRSSSVTSYALFGRDGKEVVDGRIEIGKFIRINLYGSGKYDWVEVVSITDEQGEFVITVKPSFDPTEDPVDTARTSHFFGPEARNNFCLQLDSKTVAIYVIGLNENQNTSFTEGLIESARNAAVANVGYYSGLQKAVWKEFCKNFLETEDETAG